ncbi:MAG: hypothetical protein NTZ33_13835 [Bacteroidetes bacterium]|nr:hypothetical protein [Bacteroidota bacterium]
MSKDIEELRKLLKKFGENEIIFPATIIAVNDTEDICDISAEGEFTDVKLRSIIDANGNRIVVYPKIGSKVTCGRISASNNIYILKVGEIDKIRIKIDNIDIVVNSNEIIFNKGNNKGLVIAPSLVKRLNNIEKAFNNYLKKYNTHTHQVSTTGNQNAQTGTAAAPSSGGDAIEETKLSDIENTKIKH